MRRAAIVFACALAGSAGVALLAAGPAAHRTSGAVVASGPAEDGLLENASSDDVLLDACGEVEPGLGCDELLEPLPGMDADGALDEAVDDLLAQDEEPAFDDDVDEPPPPVPSVGVSAPASPPAP
jgi:hypothetical protein